MVRRGGDAVSLSLDVLSVSKLTLHSDSAAQPLSDTHTGKVSFPPCPFLSLFLLLFSSYPGSGRHVVLISPSVTITKQRHARNTVLITG